MCALQQAVIHKHQMKACACLRWSFLVWCCFNVNSPPLFSLLPVIYSPLIEISGVCGRHRDAFVCCALRHVVPPAKWLRLFAICCVYERFRSSFWWSGTAVKRTSNWDSSRTDALGLCALCMRITVMNDARRPPGGVLRLEYLSYQKSKVLSGICVDI